MAVPLDARALSGSNPLIPMSHTNKKAVPFGTAFLFGAPLGIRTPDLRIRSALLYPAELMALITGFIILKNRMCVKRYFAYFKSFL